MCVQQRHGRAPQGRIAGEKLLGVEKIASIVVNAIQSSPDQMQKWKEK